jgi:hypothetical protein
MLHQKVSALEDKLTALEHSTVPAPKTNGRYKYGPPPPIVPVKRSYQPTVRRKAGYHARPPTDAKDSSTVPNPLHKPGVNDTAVAASPSKDTGKADSEDTAASGSGTGDNKAPEGDKAKVGEVSAAEGEQETDEVDGDLKPPVLKQEVGGDSEGAETEVKAEVGSAGYTDDASPCSLTNQSHVEEMEVEDSNDDDEEEDDDDEDDEDYEEDQKPTIIEDGVVEEAPVVGRRSGRGVKRAAPVAVEKDEDEPVVTYTTRGRRHTLPRRYAEFTGHDNVASILKSQQRAAASQGSKPKKQALEKSKTPTKAKASPVPKPITPKKAPADGTRPEVVYELITKVQNKEVDEAGNVSFDRMHACLLL